MVKNTLSENKNPNTSNVKKKKTQIRKQLPILYAVSQSLSILYLFFSLVLFFVLGLFFTVGVFELDISRRTLYRYKGQRLIYSDDCPRLSCYNSQCFGY